MECEWDILYPLAAASVSPNLHLASVQMRTTHCGPAEMKLSLLGQYTEQQEVYSPVLYFHTSLSHIQTDNSSSEGRGKYKSCNSSSRCEKKTNVVTTVKKNKKSLKNRMTALLSYPTLMYRRQASAYTHRGTHTQALTHAHTHTYTHRHTHTALSP